MSHADDPLQEPLRAGRRLTDPTLSGTAAGQTAPRETLSGTKLPVPIPGSRARDAAPPAGPVEAQILGQDGQKRGLRGGKPVLDKARSAYLGAEWSGAADRRPRQGLITKTEI